jgi:hypothetical protein
VFLHEPLAIHVAPVIANHSGAHRAGQWRDSGERSERTLDASEVSLTMQKVMAS